ncbi:MAG: DUF1775 domain-containing protein [Nitriliruptor sp.]
MRPHRPLTLAAATVALLVTSTVPASAHPFITDGATAPAGSLTTLTLAMAHGCGTEDDAGGDPTTEVALEVPSEFSYLGVDDVEGYTVSTEGDDGAVPEVVVWTATEGGVPAPEVTFDAVVDGSAGDEVHLRVFQGCEGFEYRWVGTPDEPADDPAVQLTLTDPDPDAPEPPEPAATDGADEADAQAGEDPPSAPDAEDPDASDAEAGGDGEAADASAVEDLPTEPPADGGGLPDWIWILVGALVLAAVGAAVGARRRTVLDPTARDEPPATPDDR